MNKYRRYILIGVPGLIFYFFLFFNLIGKLKDINTEILARQKKLSLYSQENSLHNYYLSLKKYTSKKLDSYKEFENVSEGITELLSLVKSFNLATNSIFHSTVRETEKIAYITVELELSGEYPDLCLFLDKLSGDAFRIEKIKVSRGSTGVLASLRIRLFLSDNVDK
jgi:hypothetical protein